jgi:GrpB-like predicted nucleotidyltransferase (UPF0157 family)
MLIQEYTKSWKEDFNQLKTVLHNALNPLKISIEHVGSTAIPHLAAKPIIDMDLVYDENIEFETIKIGLENIGYFHNGNQGILGREVFKRTKSTNKHEILDVIVHHLYICATDSDELHRHILFRNYLIAHQDARIYYQNLKYEIAMAVNQDSKKYAALKALKASSFMNNIIEKAQMGHEWCEFS